MLKPAMRCGGASPALLNSGQQASGSGALGLVGGSGRLNLVELL
jgi:hypothetical protein